MNVIGVILVAAVVTAALSAAVVAADWDLAIANAWQELLANERRPREGGYRPARNDEPTTLATWSYQDATVSVRAPIERKSARIGGVDRDEAEAWLAAAAAHQLDAYRAQDRRSPDVTSDAAAA